MASRVLRHARPADGSLVSYLCLRLVAVGEDPSPRVRVTAERDGRPLTECGHTFGHVGEEAHFRLENQIVADPVREVSAHEYAAARGSCVSYWRSVFAEGAKLTVPDRRVADAWHNLVIQNAVLGSATASATPTRRRS